MPPRRRQGWAKYDIYRDQDDGNLWHVVSYDPIQSSRWLLGTVRRVATGLFRTTRQRATGAPSITVSGSSVSEAAWMPCSTLESADRFKA